MTTFAYAALWIFVFAVPWQNMVVISGVGTISRLMGMLALGFALLAAVVSGRLRRWRLFHVAALLFVIWSGWNIYRPEIFRPGDQMMTMGKFSTYVQLFLVLWMIWELAPTVRRQRGLMMAYVLGCLVAALNTVVLSRTDVALRRFAAVGFDPNDLAMILSLALPMAWYLGITARQPLVRWFWRAYLPLGLLAIGLTGSRGGLLAASVALLIVPLTMTRLSPGGIITAIVLLGVCAGVGIAYIPETVLQRLGSTTTELQEGDLNGRLEIWKAGVIALGQKPLIGYGTGGFDRAVRPILGFGPVAHNTFLQVIVEQGLLGFFVFAAFLIAAVLQVLSLPLLERRFGLVVLATLGVAMLPLTWDQQKTLWIILALLVALAEAMRRERVPTAAAAPVRSPGPVPIVRRPLVPRAGTSTGVPRRDA